MIWNEEKECMSRDQMADLQGKQLVKLVRYMYRNVGYYRKKMKKLGDAGKLIQTIKGIGYKLGGDWNE